MNLYVLDFRMRGVGGAVGSGELFRVSAGSFPGPYDPLDLELLRADVRAAGELVLVLHGYNKTWKTGLEQVVPYLRLLHRKGVRGVLVAVLWPGDGWAKALTYPFEGRDADDTGDALARWLAVHCRARGDSVATRVSFVAHSLGSRVAMHAAERLAREPRGAVPELGRICLMAGAVDNDCLGREGVTCYRGATLRAERIAVLASEEDLILRLAYPIGDAVQTVLYAERSSCALGRTGPREQDAAVLARMDVVPLSDPFHDVDHGDYLQIEDDPAGGTIALSEDFVAPFLLRQPRYEWPVQRR